MTLAMQPDCVRMAAFYPDRMVIDQLRLIQRAGWRCAVHVSFEAEPSAVRMALLGTDVVLIDATSCPDDAERVLLEAVEQPGGYCTAVYSEVAQHRLESIVRCSGALFLLGPLDLSEWECVFEGLFAYVRRRCKLPAAGVKPLRRAA